MKMQYVKHVVWHFETVEIIDSKYSQIRQCIAFGPEFFRAIQFSFKSILAACLTCFNVYVIAFSRQVQYNFILYNTQNIYILNQISAFYTILVLITTHYSQIQCPPTVIYIPNFITSQQETAILNHVQSAPKPKWQQLSNRRLLNYGGVPHPKGMIAESMPPWLKTYVDMLNNLGNLV